MEDADGLRFHGALVELGIVHRLHVDRPLSKAYFGHLKDLPLELVLAALKELGDHAGDFFPKTEAIRETADELQIARTTAERDAIAAQPPPLQLAGDIDPHAPPAARRHWFECNPCHDSGWRPVCFGGCADPSLCTNFDHLTQRCHLQDAENIRRLGNVPGGYGLPLKACECRPNNKTYRRNNPPVVGPTFARKTRRSKRVERRSFYETTEAD
jgi:hypothetical protein